MPTFDTTHYAAQKTARANPSRFAPPNVSSGEVEFAVIPYALTSGTDEAADDIINLCVLPADVIPLPQLSSITCNDDPGTAFTVDVGTAANVDGWGDGVALTTAGQVEFCAAAHTAPAWLADTPLVEDTGSGNAIVFATVKTATAPTAGVILYFTLAYKRSRG
jgi:hypothetical protein